MRLQYRSPENLQAAAVDIGISASTGILTASLQRIPLAKHTDWKHPGKNKKKKKFAMLRDFFVVLVSNQYRLWLR